MWVRCIFRLAKCDRNFASFFIKNGSNFISNRNDDFSENFFDVYYVSVLRKLVILDIFFYLSLIME